MKKMSSFSLVETIVALVIILSVFAIAAMVLTGTARTQLTVQQLKAINLLRRYEAQTGENKIWASDSARLDGFRLFREVSAYPAYDSLLLIRFWIEDANGKNLAGWRSLVRADE